MISLTEIAHVLAPANWDIQLWPI